MINSSNSNNNQYAFFRLSIMFFLTSSFFYFQRKEIRKYNDYPQYANEIELNNIKSSIKYDPNFYKEITVNNFKSFIQSKILIIFVFDMITKIGIFKYLKPRYADSIKDDFIGIIVCDIIIFVLTPFKTVYSTLINSICFGITMIYLLNIASCFNHSNQKYIKFCTFYITAISIIKCFLFMPNESHIKYSIFLTITFIFEMISFYDICRVKFIYIVIFIGQLFLYLLSMNQNYSIISIATVSFIATMILCYDLIFNNSYKNESKAIQKRLSRDISFVAIFVLFKFFFFITFDYNFEVFLFLSFGFVIEMTIFFFDLRILGGYFIFTCAYDIALYLLYINMKLGLFVSATFIFITVITFFVISRLKLIFSKSEFMEYTDHSYLQLNVMLISAVLKYIILIIQIFW